MAYRIAKCENKKPHIIAEELIKPCAEKMVELMLGSGAKRKIQSLSMSNADIKAAVDSFFEPNELSWQNFKHICTDGAPAMIGAREGFVTLVKNEWPHVTSLHCSLHRYGLASKTLPSCLMEVMEIAVKVINFICSRAKNHRLISTFGCRNGSTTCGPFVLY